MLALGTCTEVSQGDSRVIAGLRQACIIGCACQSEIGDQGSFNDLLQQYIRRLHVAVH